MVSIYHVCNVTQNTCIYKQKTETREGAGGSVMENRLGGHSYEQYRKSHEEHWQQTHALTGTTHTNVFPFNLITVFTKSSLI